MPIRGPTRNPRIPRRRRTPRPRTSRGGVRATTVLAQTYLDRFEEVTPRAPISQQVRAQRDIGFDIERQPIQTPQAPVPADRFAELFRGGGQFTTGGINLPVLPGAEFVARNIVSPTLDFFQGAQEALAQGPAQMAAIYQNLGVNLGRQFPGSIFGTALEGETTLGAPTLGGIGARISRRGGPEQLPARRLFTTVSALYRGVRPPMIGFDAQEFLGLTDEEIEGIGYTKVPGGWVRRELWDQPLNSVYGSGTAAQPQTINVNYGGYGGGGGTRQQSSYLVNWRI